MNEPEQRPGTLERLVPSSDHIFKTPSKLINDGDDLDFFLTSTAYRDLTIWLFQLNRSMFPTKVNHGKPQSSDLNSPPSYSPSVQNLQSLLEACTALLGKAPPSTGPRRFGNVAFRDWCRLVDEEAAGLIQTHLADIIRRHSHNSSETSASLIDELKAYLLGSFGSAQRLDYGTGHELSFLAFLGSLWKLGAFEDGEERAIVMGLIQPYLKLIRTVILTYTLEPAGSHGVWGLDDHSFAPYIFGSAQLGPPIDPTDYTTPVPTEGSLSSAPPASSIAKKDMVADYKDSNMYFSAIQFIFDVKTGPFWEHSPVLYDISGIKDGWGKINKGMLKMYAAEVLGKFPVVQHFPFGSLFRWEKDPQAALRSSTVHAQQQPLAPKSKDVPIPSGNVGTAAPWAKGGGPTMPQMQASTGVPTTRAPWAGSGGGSRPQPSVTGGVAPMAAPWATTARPPPPPGSGTASTAAPWARKDLAR